MATAAAGLPPRRVVLTGKEAHALLHGRPLHRACLRLEAKAPAAGVGVTDAEVGEFARGIEQAACYALVSLPGSVKQYEQSNTHKAR